MNSSIITLEPQASDLFAQVNALHQSNIGAAQKTAGNAIQIGFLLHQIKEKVGHGNFTQAMEDHAPGVSQQCCSNYMRLAVERLVEHRARLRLAETNPPMEIPQDGKLPTVGNLDSAPLPLPKNALPKDLMEQARKDVEEISWLTVDTKPEELTNGLSGKDLTELYRDYGIIRPKLPKTYNPPAPQTPEEVIAAENQHAEDLLSDAEYQMNAIQMSLPMLTVRVAPKRWKEFLRNVVAVTKAIRPLTRRKADKPAKTKKTVGQLAAKIANKVGRGVPTAPPKLKASTLTSA
jgi:hypothetical protein